MQETKNMRSPATNRINQIAAFLREFSQNSIRRKKESTATKAETTKKITDRGINIFHLF
jgi:hypothetical protein